MCLGVERKGEASGGGDTEETIPVANSGTVRGREGDRSDGNGTDHWRRLEIEVFKGDSDAFGWVNKLEYYF